MFLRSEYDYYAIWNKGINIFSHPIYAYKYIPIPEDSWICGISIITVIYDDINALI